MTQETKAWILQVRKRAAKLHSGSNTNPWNDLEDALIQIERLEEIIESQEKEIEKLKEALQFYADKETYKRWFSKSGEEFKTYPTNASIDIGFKARQALEAK